MSSQWTMHYIHREDGKLQCEYVINTSLIFKKVT